MGDEQYIRWDDVSARMGRNDLPTILFQNWWRLHPDDKSEALVQSWYMCEWPEQHYDGSGWVSKFREVGFTIDGVPALRDQLPEVVRLYRGQVVGSEPRMSWTDDMRVAIWFAERFTNMVKHPEPTEYIIRDVPRDVILAVISDRGENEFVIDPAMLRNPVPVSG